MKVGRCCEQVALSGEKTAWVQWRLCFRVGPLLLLRRHCLLLVELVACWSSRGCCGRCGKQRFLPLASWVAPMSTEAWKIEFCERRAILRFGGSVGGQGLLATWSPEYILSCLSWLGPCHGRGQSPVVWWVGHKRGKGAQGRIAHSPPCVLHKSGCCRPCRCAKPLQNNGARWSATGSSGISSLVGDRTEVAPLFPFQLWV